MVPFILTTFQRITTGQEFSHKGCAKLGLRYYDKTLPIHSTYGGYGKTYGHACKVIHRTWELIDWCQYNSGYGGYGAKGKWTYIQKIYVYDEVAPTITFCSDDIDANGGDCIGGKTFVKIPKVEATDDCGTVYYAFSRKKIEEGTSYHSYSGGGVRYSGSDASGYYEPGMTLVTFEAFDVCGNTTECQMVVNVKALDTKPPTVIGISSLTAVLVQSDTNDGSVELWPSEFNTSSSDNCTEDENLKFELEPSVFTCADFGSNQVKFTVTDEAGNSDYIMVEVIVQANSFECIGGVVSGNVSSDAGKGIDEVQVTLMDGMQQMTDEKGGFTFDEIPLGRDIFLTPYKNTDATEGIDMYDYALLSLHVDGIRELTDPYQLVAADINGDKQINYSDLLAMQRLITGLDKSMAGEAWKIFGRDFIFPDTIHPLDVEIPTSYRIERYDGSDLHVPFMAVKIGDLGSLTPDPDGDTAPGSSHLVTNDRLVKAGEERIIPFTFGDVASANSVTFTIDLDPTKLSLVDVRERALADKGVLDFVTEDGGNGSIAFTWYSLSEKTFSVEDVLFELVVEAKQNVALSKTLSVTSSMAEAQTVGVVGGTNKLSIDFTKGQSQKEIALFQNAPNPFKENTMIGFFMGEAGEATLTIKDLTGRTLIDRSGYYEEGYQEVRIDRKDLRTNGLLFYNLIVGENKITKKMMLMH